MCVDGKDSPSSNPLCPSRGAVPYDARSGQELDEAFLQYGLGLLLIAKSDQDSVFRMLLSSVKSSDGGTKEQARRAVCRWARSNQRGDAYSVLVGKARTISVGKGEAVVCHFKSISTEEGIQGGDGSGAMRAVSSSLLELLETRTAGHTSDALKQQQGVIADQLPSSPERVPAGQTPCVSSSSSDTNTSSPGSNTKVAASEPDVSVKSPEAG